METPPEQPRNLNSKSDRVQLPAWMIPGFKTDEAIQNNCETNLMFKTWGGIGDQICAEPTLRYAFKEFKECDISLATEHPNLFRHLPFKKTFDLKETQPFWERYLTFETIVNPQHLAWQFFSHCVTNCVDYCSLCAYRCQLPVKDREIHMKPREPSRTMPDVGPKTIYIHPGKHWPSKTFPKWWWDAVIKLLVAAGYTPILIGGDTDDNRTTVDVDTTGCVDMRNKFSLEDSIWYLQRATVVLTNDSAPLHMAATQNPDDPDTGNAWIGFIATCKHPDYISHWRKGQWAWREENLGLGGMWDLINNCPNKSGEITVEFVEEEQLLKWLPEPEKVVEWTLNKLNS